MRRLLFLTFLILIGAYSLTQCSSSEGEVNEVSQSIENEGASSMTYEEVADRIAEIEKCAKCHQEEYDNWLIGPHANSYTNLVEHVDHVKSSGNFPPSYNGFLPTVLDNICMGCHTGVNLYESVFKGLDSEKKSDHFNKEHYPNYLTHALPRKGDKKLNLSTGVDCLTCHSSGKMNVTNGNFQKNSTASCELVTSEFFSTNMNCYSCHYSQVESMNRLVSENKLEKVENCVACHQAYSPEGKPTHYYYWRHDHDSIVRPEKMNVFEDVSFEVKDDNAIRFEWKNSYIPHDFSECGEAVLYVTIYDAQGKKVKKFKEYVNMKSHLSTQRPEHFQHGEMGHRFGFKDNPISRDLKFDRSITDGTVHIEGWVKPQYWSNEKELKQVFQKDIQL